MKTLFTLLFVLAVILIGLGFYRGWFTLSSPEADNGSNKVELNLTVDQDKMKEDANAVKDKALELTDGTKDSTGTTENGAKDGAKDGEIGD